MLRHQIQDGEDKYRNESLYGYMVDSDCVEITAELTPEVKTNRWFYALTIQTRGFLLGVDPPEPHVSTQFVQRDGDQPA